ncbi:MAG: hypothetical protein H0W58_14110 [Acidobacteria bacterium]|jgi:predicted nucleotidyltransferase|nr:hypothetical protein [Acidobacteriota bacterium]
MVELEAAIKTLTENKVDFVVIGGVAISVHSTGYVTRDLDFCYRRTTKNLKKIISAFAPFDPRLRGFPKGLPFFWDEKTLLNGTNFTLETDIGDIDLLGEVAGVGTFKEAFENSIVVKLYDYKVHVLSLEDLIKAKRAAGRTKDLLVLPELEALQEALKETE